MTTSENVKQLLATVFHEDADLEMDLAQELLSYIQAINEERRLALLIELQEMAALSQAELALFLEEIEFVWELGGQEILFVTELVDFVFEKAPLVVSS